MVFPFWETREAAGKFSAPASDRPRLLRGQPGAANPKSMRARPNPVKWDGSWPGILVPGRFPIPGGSSPSPRERIPELSPRLRAGISRSPALSGAPVGD